MFDLLKNLYGKIESLRGKNLVVTLFIIFVVFTSVGFIYGYITQFGLNDYEVDVGRSYNNSSAVMEKISLKGKIEYINPDTYGVSYVLVNENGEDVVFLTADDQKLELSEGLFVTVIGTKKPKRPGQELDTLVVEEVAISNASN